MSFFRPKAAVTVGDVQSRLLDLYTKTSRALAGALAVIDQTIVGKDVYLAMKDHTDGLAAFSMRFTIKTVADPEVATKLLGQLVLPVVDLELQQYWTRFHEIENAGSLFRDPESLAMTAGLAFQETCGSIGSAGADNLVRQFGSQVFTRMFRITENELKAAPITL